ncbi:hypothetical protein HPB48_016027 [Haemaphysalis longicornis]|uniref:DIX domain-containing protein n=1 Tax=Haemaphysalis longicornis TaxID=44386 RepID=A0A9J6G1Y5_HAELO|nr:hypothetical protein HPB48_016027 [Haemaphysalis longicornis]
MGCERRLLRGRHSSRPPDKADSDRDKGGGGGGQRSNSPFLHAQHELLSKVPGAESDTTRRIHEENQREELRVTQEALSSLRQCFRLDDPYQHTLDTIEQSLCTLLERVTCMEKMAAASTGSTRDGVARRLNFDSTGDPRRLPITTLEEYPGYRTETCPPLASLGHCSQAASTKVIYYTERSVTPFLLSDIRLRDFKVAFDRPGQYRFHFKTLDPEFGMVKEELRSPLQTKQPLMPLQECSSTSSPRAEPAPLAMPSVPGTSAPSVRATTPQTPPNLRPDLRSPGSIKIVLLLLHAHLNR